MPPPRIAYFSPLPSDRTGIAEYSAELLVALGESADVTAFHPNPEFVNLNPTTNVGVRSAEQFAEMRWQFDIPLYHMGNSSQHTWLYQLLKRYPGVVVLHDWVLHHFMAEPPQQYARELAYARGARAGSELFFGRTQPDPASQPLNRRVLDLALGVIVHSHYAADKVRATHPDMPVAVIPQLMSAAAPPQRSAEPFTFGSFGHITPNKHIDKALAAFARLHAADASVHYVLVGSANAVDMPALLAALPDSTRAAVTWHDYLADFADFERILASADAVINLRTPTMGETSATALRALAHSAPLIVSDTGWYAELPDSVALKLPTPDVDLLVDAMKWVRAQHRPMAQAARQHILDHHLPQAAAQQMIAFCNVIFGMVHK